MPALRVADPSPDNTAGSPPAGTSPPPYPDLNPPGCVRTSRSEDHLQFTKDPLSCVDIDLEDCSSSLHTLLDTRRSPSPPPPPAASPLSSPPPPPPPPPAAATDRIVWTYNAPPAGAGGGAGGGSSSESSMSSSPQRSLSPQSPTSVSSSVMSSNASSPRHHHPPHLPAASPPPYPDPDHPPASDLSQSEAVSNISSPDFHEDVLSSRDLLEMSDPSDSDSTLLVSDRVSDRVTGNNARNAAGEQHRIVIQVQGPAGARVAGGGGGSPSSAGSDAPELAGYQELLDCDDDPAPLSDEDPPPPSSLSEEDSDLESLHSFHFCPKAVDVPSAVRLAKRLFALDGFKKSDVSRHLSKNNEFSRAVADEYLRYFRFEGDSLDSALRKFLQHFSLAGETQERERVLVHFSKRYLDCNPHSFNSQDGVHTLTCAIMLLNTDLHGQNIGRKMTCSEFIENLSDLNDGENFPRDVLKLLYQAIKCCPLEWALDQEGDECTAQLAGNKSEGGHGTPGSNPFLDVPNASAAIEYKKGYVMRKCCVDANGKKTVFGKRGWKMLYCTLRGMVLYLHKDEHGFRRDTLQDNVHNTIRVHHGLATKAADYTKKQHVFRLQTAQQAEYLFQTSDSKELQSWIDTINFVCASFSAQPLAGGVGSQRRFQPPLLPCSHTKLNLRDQLRDHEDRVLRLEAELDDHRRHPPDRGSKTLGVSNYKEKDAYLQYELKRYKTYSYLLRSRISQCPDLDPCPELLDPSLCCPLLPDPPPLLIPPPVPDRRAPPAPSAPVAAPSPNNRYSYRAAIYSGGVGAGGGGGREAGDIG